MRVMRREVLGVLALAGAAGRPAGAQVTMMQAAAMQLATAGPGSALLALSQTVASWWPGASS